VTYVTDATLLHCCYNLLLFDPVLLDSANVGEPLGSLRTPEFGLSHFIGHRFDIALRIVARIAGLRVSNDGRARKSTISQEVIVVIALCWPEDDVDYNIVYFNIEVGFGRLLHGGTRLR